MAHIAKFLVDSDSYISKQASQHPNDSNDLPPPPPEKPFTWRMQQPEPPRKYQLFPRERRLPVLNSNKPAPDVEKPLPAVGADKQQTPPQQSAANAIKKRLNQHSLVRRRKVSVPELGPMTTVQEVSMDSPTIPGRPPLHERSNSAPGRSSRKHQLADTFFYAESDDEASDILSPVAESLASRNSTGPLSPKQLAPLVIPKSDFIASRLRRQQSLSHFPGRSDSLRKTRTEGSPRSRTPLTTPSSSLPDLTSPKSASTTATSGAGISTPVSAPIMESRTASPKPWEASSTPSANTESPAPIKGHRRGGSESSGIMDRGRPRKRSDIRNNPGPIIQRMESKRSKSSDQLATQNSFEKLPVGIKLSEASEKLQIDDIALLQKQAVAQAERFEVLRPADVELLSRELRHLDERTEYLRRTYNSLRAGRRNLHSRICQYLRSPRMVKFSHESMLRQEEALAELDASIDDWVNKLEQSENRRTRVRQKLLEHVAAAATLSLSGNASLVESTQQTTGSSSMPGVGNISTPPRSPSKQTCTSTRARSKSPPPQKFAASVPSTIFEHPHVEEAAIIEEYIKGNTDERPTSTESSKRIDVESIRIYAGDDVYALLADVENEITKMSTTAIETSSKKATDSLLAEPKRIALHRQKSHERLINGGSDPTHASPKLEPVSFTSRPPHGLSPTTKDAAVQDGSIPILSNTVYKP